MVCLGWRAATDVRATKIGESHTTYAKVSYTKVSFTHASCRSCHEFFRLQFRSSRRSATRVTVGLDLVQHQGGSFGSPVPIQVCLGQCRLPIDRLIGSFQVVHPGLKTSCRLLPVRQNLYVAGYGPQLLFCLSEWTIRRMNNNVKAQLRKPEAPSFGNNAAFPRKGGVWLADPTLHSVLEAPYAMLRLSM